MATVELKNITKVYDCNVKAVDNVNIDIQDREFVVLVGPSGCGKSTTLRMVADLRIFPPVTVSMEDGEPMSAQGRDIAMVSRTMRCIRT